MCDHTTGCEAYSFATDGYGSGQISVRVTTDGYGSGHMSVRVTTDGYGSGQIWVRAVHKQVCTRVDTRRDRTIVTYPVPRADRTQGLTILIPTL